MAREPGEFTIAAGQIIGYCKVDLATDHGQDLADDAATWLDTLMEVTKGQMEKKVPQVRWEVQS